jgi:hypothetical protein
MDSYDCANRKVDNEAGSETSREAQLPSCARIMLLSSWPQSTLTKSDCSVDRTCLRSQFGQVAEAEWHHLYRAAIRAGIDANAAEDLVQSVLLHAFCALEKMKKTQLNHLRVHSWLTNLAERAARSTQS